MIVSLETLLVFFLIFSRIVGLVTFAPLFNEKRIFSMIKVVLAFWVSTLLVFYVPLPTEMPDGQFAYALALVLEFFIGMLIGFIADLFTIGVEFAGSLMDTQAGLSVANLLDPSTGRQITLISLLMKWAIIMYFLVVGGHHMVLSALVKSFNFIPIGMPVNFSEGSRFILTLGADLFLVAVQISAPILLVVFLVDFCFGMLTKVAPQINVFQLGFQIKPIISLFIFMLVLPGLTNSMLRLIDGIMGDIIQFFGILRT